MRNNGSRSVTRVFDPRNEVSCSLVFSVSPGYRSWTSKKTACPTATWRGFVYSFPAAPKFEMLCRAISILSHIQHASSQLDSAKAEVDIIARIWHHAGMYVALAEPWLLQLAI
jgi:hypothetical protein